MKTSIYLTGIALLLAAVITTGQLCPSGDDTGNENENTNEEVNENTNEEVSNVNEEPASQENPFAGTWSWTTSEDGKTIMTTVVVNDDGSHDIPNVWVGTADSLTSTVTEGETSVTVPLSGEFGIYRVEGNSITMTAENGTTEFTGEFTNPERTRAGGTWVHTQRGTTGTWTAVKGVEPEEEEAPAEQPSENFPNT